MADSFGAQQTLDFTILGPLKDQQIKREDGETVQTARGRVIECADKLVDCLDDIHSPDSRSGDPEITDDDVKKMVERAGVAEKELLGIMMDFDSRAVALADAFDAEINSVRARIRALDDNLLSGSH